MARSTFVYVTYIRTTPEKPWSALTDDVEFMKQYWFGTHCESQWTAGSPWKHVSGDGVILDAVKLSITHTIEREPSKLIVAVSGGWPKVISNLKSLLEIGSTVLQEPYPIESAHTGKE
jgi:uncharacterized protein YndB with AHSA1/START domain